MFKTQLYCVQNKRFPDENGYFEREANVVQLKEGDFQIWQSGFLGIIVDNVLIDNDLGSVLEKYVSEQIKLYFNKNYKKSYPRSLGKLFSFGNLQ